MVSATGVVPLILVKVKHHKRIFDKIFSISVSSKKTKVFFVSWIMRILGFIYYPFFENHKTRKYCEIHHKLPVFLQKQ